MSGPVVQVRDLAVSLNERDVLSGVTAEMRVPGVVLVGPAGCGKSTLLKALCGLIPFRGTVLLDGTPISPDGDASRAADFGFVFQSDALFDDRDALSNVMFPLLQRGVAEDDARRRSETALAAVGLADAAGALPEHLSGGMKKRLGIARAIVARPSVLLADDPLAGLDPGTGRRILDLLASVGALHIVAASDPLPFADLCPRLLALDSTGRLQLQGPTHELARSSKLEQIFHDAEIAVPHQPELEARA